MHLSLVQSLYSTIFMSQAQGETPSSPLDIDSSSEDSSEEGTSPLKVI